MENISNEILVNIADQSTSLISQVNGAITWVEQYLKAEDKQSTQYELKKIRRELKKIRYSITQKPTAALYGESQVGKSYLIKNLLSIPGEELNIYDVSSGNTPYDFLEDINPKGDQTEATSVVTRFTIDKHYINDRYPITIKLLTPKDIVLFLCDSYYSDITDHTYSPKPDDIQNKITALEQAFGRSGQDQAFLEEDDIFEIKEYLNENFRIHVEKFNDADFWTIAAGFIHRVAPKDWHQVFQLIWGENVVFNEIFNKLIRELETLQFSSVIYAEFKAVLRKHGTILHVARLQEIVDDNTTHGDASDFLPEVKIMYQHGGNQVERVINKSILCALCGELVLQLSSNLTKDKEFLKNSDLLDFPGARSRLEYKEAVISRDLIARMVLRGKVSYIFNKYSSDRLISNLLFCNRDAKIEVTYIPKLLNRWIEQYIGDQPPVREDSLKHSPVPPIFVIFTFFNNDLKFNEKNDRSDRLSEKWIKRFNTIFEDEIVTKNFNWHKNWTVSDRNFKNFYLLRDYTHSKETYTGYSEKKMEIKHSDIHFGDKFYDHADYFTQLKASFLDFPFVKNHFKNPQENWDEAADLNKDGSEFIIRNLTSVSTNEVRTHRFVTLLNENLRKAYNLVEKHYHSDEADEQIKTAARTGADIHANMNTLFSKNPNYFGQFIRAFMVKESVIYNFYHSHLKNLDLIEKTNLNQYIYFRESSPELSNQKNYQENLEVLRKTYHLKDTEEVEAYFQEKQIDLQELFYGELNALKNNSLTLAEGLRDFWFDNYLKIEQFKPFIEDGFSQSALEKLLDNIKINFNKQKIIHTIASNIKQYVDRYDKIQQAEEMIADISAGTINGFINSMGWQFYSENEIEKITLTSKANDLNLVLPSFDVVFESMEEEDLDALFANVDRLNESLSKSPPDEEAIKNVPVIRQYRRWRDLMKVSFVANCDIPNYDPEGNRKLRILLDNMRIYKFSAK